LSRVTARQVASHEVRRPRKFVCVQPVELSGSPPSPRPRRFRRGLATLTGTPSPIAFTIGSSFPFRASSECFLLAPARAPFSRRLLPWGWHIPHRDISWQRRYGELPSPAVFRPRRFTRPRRFRPPPALWVYFAPQPRPGFTQKRHFLSHSRPASSANLCPLVVGPPTLSTVSHRRHVKRPRPQGFFPCESPVGPHPVFSRMKTSGSLLGFSSSRFSIFRPPGRLHVPYRS